MKAEKLTPAKTEPTPSENEVLRRMLHTPPAPHKPKAKAKPKKRSK